MISKPQEPVIIGRNKDIPEGIFGAMEVPKNNSTAATKKRKKKRKEQEPQFLTVGEHQIELTDMVPMSITIKGKKSKASKPTKKKKRVIQLERPKTKKAKRGVMPNMNINYDATLPEEAEGIDFDNVVAIPERVLKGVVKKTEQRTRKLSDLMLNSITPAMLSYDSASNYVKAALRDGLKIEVDVDRGVLDVVKELSRLDVIFFYVKRLNIPKSLKKQFMNSFIEELSKASIESMRKTDKSDEISSQLRELQGVIMKRSEHQSREKDRASHKRIGLTEDTASAKRSRQDSHKPVAGF